MVRLVRDELETKWKKCPGTKWRYQHNNSVTTKNEAAYCYKKL